VIKIGELRDYDGYIEEIIDSNVFYMLPGMSDHIKAITRIAYKFNHYFEIHDKNCMAYTEGLEVYLDPNNKKYYVVPDISIICEDFDGRGFYGSPELIVEVLSYATAKKDRNEKFKAYEKAGVKEYWIVDTKSKSIEQYTLKDEEYELKNVIALISDIEYDKLTDEQKNSYTTKISPSIFEDLEIDLNYIFNLTNNILKL